MAAVPSIGRADRVSGAPAPEADLTRALYERYSTQIFRFCIHQLGSREEAEDAVQSTFLNAFRGIKRGVVPELESAWLFKIAENVCLSRRRSTWRRNRIESTADFEVVEELTPAPSRLADELVGLQDVLEQMPESQRRAILLREWQGLSYREIAAELELSQTAVETLIFRARRSLAKGLAEPAAPAEKRRLVRGADLGNVLTGLKSILFGGAAAAAKTAAIVAVVGAGTVAVADPAQHHPQSHVPASSPASAPAPSSLPLPGPASVHPAPAALPRPTHPSTSKAAAGSAPRPAIGDSPVAPATEAPRPPVTEEEPATPPASPAGAQTPPGPAPAPPVSNGHGNGQGQGHSGQGAGQGQGNPGQGNPGQGQGQGNSGDQSGRGQANSDPGQGDSRQGQGPADSSATGSTPPPTGASDPGGNGGNGQGSGQGDGGGHGGGPGHGH